MPHIPHLMAGALAPNRPELQHAVHGAQPIVPRDITWEVDYPTYRVTCWRRDGSASDGWRLTDAINVHDVLAWATARLEEGLTYQAFQRDEGDQRSQPAPSDQPQPLGRPQPDAGTLLRVDPPHQRTWFTCHTATYPRSPDGLYWKPAADAVFNPDATSRVTATATTRMLAITIAQAAMRPRLSVGGSPASCTCS